ncbi:ORF6N domain-containing protein [Ureibacillus manganicus]|uniref:KilA-N DNA-binding domain-containing protein n=1 Tax=Ureibacillus manganicus DSM 26584 TaxID=1384049 RepID=A0A0A3I2L5_9BACL|nr:ORF6N domain-containing protein [Ureibacillus manganicus]KGR78954.1 hypothetical protein CD29_07970 [Ureibacillus manganicus DSM 26584]
MEYQDLLVVTTYRLAETFQCSAEKLIWNFLQHEDQFVEGVHYYQLNAQELESLELRYPQEFTECVSPFLWTLEGMYKHAQLLTGIEAWRAYMNFVYLHFSDSEELKEAVHILENATKQLEALYIYRICEKEWNAQ